MNFFICQQFKEFSSIEVLSDQFGGAKEPENVAKGKDVQETAVEKDTAEKDTGDSKETDASKDMTAVASEKSIDNAKPKKGEKKNTQEEVSIVKVENPKDAVYLDDQPLSIRQKEKLKRNTRSKRKKRSEFQRNMNLNYNYKAYSS